MKNFAIKFKVINKEYQLNILLNVELYKNIHKKILINFILKQKNKIQINLFLLINMMDVV